MYKTTTDDMWHFRPLADIMSAPTTTNHRTGVGTKRVPHIHLSFDCSDGYYVPMTTRAIYPHIAAAEALWMLQGTQDPSFIARYSPMWAKFTDEEGKVAAAYGYRWRKAFGRDQLQQALKTLSEDPSNRQVILMAWDPSIDGLGNYHAKNVPCPFAFTLNIIDGKLNGLVSQRSGDFLVGVMYDILCYQTLLAVFAATLGVPLGQLSFTIADCHVYEPHFEAALEMLAAPESPPLPRSPLLRKSVETALSAPNLYVETVRQAQTVSSTRYKMEIVE